MTAWPRPRAISQRFTGTVSDEGDHEAEGEAPPEERVAEAGGDRTGNEQDEGVVDDLHRRDRDGVRGEGDPGRATKADPGP